MCKRPKIGSGPEGSEFSAGADCHKVWGGNARPSSWWSPTRGRPHGRSECRRRIGAGPFHGQYQS
eukprot:9342415-Prorocentrum_lima.AAC.1